MADKVEVKFKIKDEDCTEFMEGFLASTPVPPGIGQWDWPETYCKQVLFNQYKTGKIILAQQDPDTQTITIEDL